MEPRARREFLKAIEELKRESNYADLKRALENRDYYGVETALGVGLLPERLSVLRDTILDGVQEAGRAEAAKLSRQVGITLRFDLTNPRSIEFIRQHGAELVREMSWDMRAAIQRVIQRGFEEGVAPPTMARQLRGVSRDGRMVGGRLGLTTRQAEIVANYEAALRQAIAGDISFAELNRAYTLNPVRGPGGLIEGRIQSAVRQYEERMVRMRADAIARTETLRAANVGQHELWKQAQETGAIAMNQEREWLTAEDEGVCPVCEPLNGERVLINQAFSSGDEEPPAHPSCRCTVILVFD